MRIARRQDMTTPLPNEAAGALAGLGLCVLLPALGISIANVALPTLSQAFGVPFGAVQWVVLAYLLANTTLVVGVGHLGDRIGRRRLLLLGIVLFTAASAACAAAPDLVWLVAARALQGLGAAVLMALGMAMVGDVVPRERAGRAMGLLGTMSAVGTALGPSLGGLLLEAFGWRAVFLAGVVPGGLAGWLAWRFLPADRDDAAAAPGRFDTAGALLLALTLAAYALAMTRGADAAVVAVAGGGLVAFVVVKRRAPAPLLPLARLRDPGLVASMLVATVMMTTLVVGPFHLSHGLGLGPAAAGLAMSAGPLVSALMGVPAGRWVDRFGAARLSALGLASLAVSAFLLSLVPAAWGVAGYVLPLVGMTAGYAVFQAANNTAVMAAVAAGERGAVSGLLTLSRNLGFITGASAMGAVFANGMGPGSGAAAVAMGTRLAFEVAGALATAALLIVLAGRLRLRRRAAPRA
jgi:MFS family permease